MANKPMNLDVNEGENHEIGRKLYEKDQQLNQANQTRYAYRGNQGTQDRKWSEGNFFHTGPSPRGAQDRQRNEGYRRGGSSHTSYNQGQNAHLGDHYGSRSDSSYRNERSYIDHGDHGSSQYRHDERHSMRRPQTPGGSLQGNYEDVNRTPYEPWNEGPGSGSRYKESDYRYGSGSHNWYRENRFTPDDDRDRHHDDRGFIDRMKDTWNDIWHSDDKDYQPRHHPQSSSDRLDTRQRYGSAPYRDRSFDRGYEGGPRWADESGSRRDDDYSDRDDTNRYRR
jgi:hypothetical protein